MGVIDVRFFLGIWLGFITSGGDYADVDSGLLFEDVDGQLERFGLVFEIVLDVIAVPEFDVTVDVILGRSLVSWLCEDLCNVFADDGACLSVSVDVVLPFVPLLVRCLGGDDDAGFVLVELDGNLMWVTFAFKSFCDVISEGEEDEGF